VQSRGNYRPCGFVFANTETFSHFVGWAGQTYGSSFIGQIQLSLIYNIVHTIIRNFIILTLNGLVGKYSVVHWKEAWCKYRQIQAFFNRVEWLERLRYHWIRQSIAQELDKIHVLHVRKFSRLSSGVGVLESSRYLASNELVLVYIRSV